MHRTEVAIAEPFRVQRRQRAQPGAARGVGTGFLAPERQAARAAVGLADDVHRLAYLLEAQGDLASLERSACQGSAFQQI